MNSNKTFRIALFISLLTHGTILLYAPRFINTPTPRKTPEVEITYVQLPKQPKPDHLPEPRRVEPSLPVPRQALGDAPPSGALPEHKDVFRTVTLNQQETVAFSKPAFDKADIITVKKKITVPAMENMPVNSPSYISYYHLVREKIKRAAYQNYVGREEGEVFLSFVVLADGILKDIWLKEEKSSSNSYLRSIAARSIKEAAPFSSFPSELSEYPQLLFNIAITFEIE